ncbi:MAG: hydantoinase B/oxoprolinase family protein [Candidatus Heimdallarchaeota archaeon]
MDIDPVSLSIIQRALENIAEEMGIVLQRSSFSANCKERLDFSCCIYLATGEMIAQAEHIPVHLGAMFSAAHEILEEFSIEEFQPGDIIIYNSPYRGGTHLPDVTFFMPVYLKDKIIFFVANRAHHADIGGATPGSMPGVSYELFEEGLIIPPLKLYERDKENESVFKLILGNVRVPDERIGDFRAQRAALLRGKNRLEELTTLYGWKFLNAACEELLNLSEKAFSEQIAKIQIGSAPISFEDFLDSNGITETPIKIRVSISKKGEKIHVSFQGTDAQQEGNVNAPKSVTYSCVFYVFRCLTDPSIMTNAGLFRNLVIQIPSGSLLDPKFPAAVSSGNVETSQRVVDVLLGALAQIQDTIPAASQGTMNNISIGGKRPDGSPFAYYETLGGGTGAAFLISGESGIHSHMTNTRNTPIASLEMMFPLRVLSYGFRDGSGGAGKAYGGMGIIREILCLTNCVVSLQTERRKFAPYGLHGGENGINGVNIKRTIDGQEIVLPGRVTLNFNAGETLIIKTPGGGGYGPPNNE